MICYHIYYWKILFFYYLIKIKIYTCKYHVTTLKKVKFIVVIVNVTLFSTTIFKKKNYIHFKIALMKPHYEYINN